MARSGWTCDLGDGHDEAYETYKHSVAVATSTALPFSFFVLVQKDDGVVVAPPPGGAGVCGGSDREWMYESVGYNVCLLVRSTLCC